MEIFLISEDQIVRVTGYGGTRTDCEFKVSLIGDFSNLQHVANGKSRFGWKTVKSAACTRSAISWALQAHCSVGQLFPKFEKLPFGRRTILCDEDIQEFLGENTIFNSGLASMFSSLNHNPEILFLGLTGHWGCKIGSLDAFHEQLYLGYNCYCSIWNCVF
jgi:hypothetical protein